MLTPRQDALCEAMIDVARRAIYNGEGALIRGDLKTAQKYVLSADRALNDVERGFTFSRGADRVWLRMVRNLSMQLSGLAQAVDTAQRRKTGDDTSRDSQRLVRKRSRRR